MKYFPYLPLEKEVFSSLSPEVKELSEALQKNQESFHQKMKEIIDGNQDTSLSTYSVLENFAKQGISSFPFFKDFILDTFYKKNRLSLNQVLYEMSEGKITKEFSLWFFGLFSHKKEIREMSIYAIWQSILYFYSDNFFKETENFIPMIQEKRKCIEYAFSPDPEIATFAQDILLFIEKENHSWSALAVS